MKDEAGKAPAAEGASHGEEKAPAHGEAPAAVDHGADAAQPSAEEPSAPAGHGAAQPEAPAAEAPADIKPEAEADHGAAADHGVETPTIDAAPAHDKPAAHEASTRNDPVLETVNAADHKPAEAEGEQPAAEPKKDDHRLRRTVVSTRNISHSSDDQEIVATRLICGWVLCRQAECPRRSRLSGCACSSICRFAALARNPDRVNPWPGHRRRFQQARLRAG